ncbi:PAS domain S-box-containing protein [Chryseobacterium sp. CBTAP 102]|uniref:PAS domain-containing hybrid sensor histidine kinase/response regulator n=1 Tax=Chryseobacterium sp. CBTAP 102 TaxID=2135644 RepID=UPI000D765164|nr:response regulator [Chryseobacterium sp. CBTAP 102]PXW09768.1 PAS domain S-box-containing protein [Chryseobacterium sp. CBTAP 102]
MEIKFHNLLERQINKYLTEDCKNHPQFKRFIHAVNESYKSFERDKELMDYAFKQSEEEYQELYQNLKNENTLKHESISNLYESLKIIDSDIEIKKSEDLKELSLYLSEQLRKRKRAEDYIKQQEEKYRNIIANMNLGLIEVDNDEIIRYANQSFCNVSGFELDEVIGKNPSTLFLYGENHLRFLQEQIELRKKGISSVYQLPVRNKRGEIRWWAVSGAPNYDDLGNLLGSIGIHLDITDQKKLEEELKLEKAKALEASKAKEVFLANMSHEIRTPLNGIIGFLRELKRSDLPDEQKQFVENSYNASQHLLSIINNILDISKIESGEMSLEHKSFSLKDSIQKVISVLKPKAEEKNLKIITDFSADIFPVLKGDSLRLEQVLYNIIGNSLKFTNEGHIKVESNVLKSFSNQQTISISITDTGIGMSEEYVRNIFNKFNQEDSSISRKYGGTGLGMSITKELVHLMKGEINVKSEKNSGTCITIILILDRGDEKALKESTWKNQHISIAGTKVLLVEDNALNQLVAERSLKHFECNVVKAENGKIALEILSREQFDIILMDLQMPEMDGIEATKILRNELGIKAPVIALTANAFKTEIDNCINAGMNDYITKPFNEENLLKIIYKYVKIPEKTIETMSDAGETFYSLKNIQVLSRGDKDFMRKMLLIFIGQTETTLPIMKKAFDEKNYVEIGRLMHKIRPSIQAMGINSIENEVKQLELLTIEENKEFPELSSLFEKIKETLETVVTQLKDEISQSI